MHAVYKPPASTADEPSAEPSSTNLLFDAPAWNAWLKSAVSEMEGMMFCARSDWWTKQEGEQSSTSTPPRSVGSSSQMTEVEMRLHLERAVALDRAKLVEEENARLRLQVQALAQRVDAIGAQSTRDQPNSQRDDSPVSSSPVEAEARRSANEHFLAAMVAAERAQAAVARASHEEAEEYVPGS